MRERAVNVQIPVAFKGLFQPYRYKAFYGGRGSGKSHSFAQALVINAANTPDYRILCCREIQKSIKDSVKQLLEDKIRATGLGHFFKSTETEIVGTNGSRFSFAGLRTNPDSVKSMEGLDVAWVEEASRVSQKSLDLLTPTLRKSGSELWFSWNPESEYDPVDAMFRGPHPPPDALVKRVDYRDNPYFPDVLRSEMDHAYQVDAGKAEWIWGGEYKRLVEGAYFAKELSLARAENRICRVVRDAMLPVRAVFDIGMADATAIWIVQWIGREIRYLDYIEATGQPLSYYAQEIRARGWGDAELILPHDGAHREKVSGSSYADHFRQAGFTVKVIPNQGKGAAKERIEAARRVFNRCWFDLGNCEGGLKALASYHEKIDEDRRIGLGPEHDWSSHGADAFGLSCVVYDEPRAARRPDIRRHQGPGAWMG